MLQAFSPIDTPPLVILAYAGIQSNNVRKAVVMPKNQGVIEGTLHATDALYDLQTSNPNFSRTGVPEGEDDEQQSVLKAFEHDTESSLTEPVLLKIILKFNSFLRMSRYHEIRFTQC